LDEENRNNEAAGILLQELHQKPDNKSYSSGGKFWKCPHFWSCSAREGFTFYSSFFILLSTKIIMGPLAVPKDRINSNPYWII
jgi:hypothetical protein